MSIFAFHRIEITPLCNITMNFLPLKTFFVIVYERFYVNVQIQVSCHKPEKLNSLLVCNENVMKNLNIRDMVTVDNIFSNLNPLLSYIHKLKQE